MSRMDYKNNVDQKISLANTAAVAAEGARKDKQFAEASKNPLKPFNGPEEFGSIKMLYPKTWSGYVDATGGEGLDGYFNLDTVPSVSDENSTFALRLQVVNESYSEVVSAYDDQEGLIITPYALPKLPKTIGVKLTGQIEEEKQGTMVIVPVRDKTIQIYTESKTFENDFNNIILPNFSFSP